MTQLGEIRIGNRNRGDEGIFVGRPSVFGTAIGKQPLRRAVEQLALRVMAGENITLVCFCAPKRCHAEPLRDEILLFAEKLAQKMLDDSM